MNDKAIGKRIQAARKQKGISQLELSEQLGYSGKSSISKIERGVNAIPINKLKRIAELLGVPLNYLIGDDYIPDSVRVEHVSIPVLGSISCGQPIFAEQNTDFAIAGPMSKRVDYSLQAKGQSMINAGIEDGDYVLIHAQDAVDNGEIAVVMIGDEATLKRFYHYPERDLMILRPENPAYPDQIYQGEDLAQVRVLGKAIGVQKEIV